MDYLRGAKVSVSSILRLLRRRSSYSIAWLQRVVRPNNVGPSGADSGLPVARWIIRSLRARTWPEK